MIIVLTLKESNRSFLLQNEMQTVGKFEHKQYITESNFSTPDWLYGDPYYEANSHWTVKKFSAFYRTQRSIIVITRARFWRYPAPDESSPHPNHPIFLKSTLVLYFVPRAWLTDSRYPRCHAHFRLFKSGWSTFSLPYSQEVFLLDPRAKKPLLAPCLKTRSQFSLPLTILLQKWQIAILYAQIGYQFYWNVYQLL
jgi:hypothetical protein